PENHTFQAGAPGKPGELVQLYVELRNFCSEPRSPYHETRLSSAVEIKDGQGTRIWYYRFDDRKPLQSRSRLNDHYSNYSFHVPHVAAGDYTLTLHGTDETLPEHRREARKSVPFRVVAGSP